MPEDKLTTAWVRPPTLRRRRRGAKTAYYDQSGKCRAGKAQRLSVKPYEMPVTAPSRDATPPWQRNVGP